MNGVVLDGDVECRYCCEIIIYAYSSQCYLLHIISRPMSLYVYTLGLLQRGPLEKWSRNVEAWLSWVESVAGASSLMP